MIVKVRKVDDLDIFTPRSFFEAIHQGFLSMIELLLDPSIIIQQRFSGVR